MGENILKREKMDQFLSVVLFIDYVRSSATKYTNCVTC